MRSINLDEVAANHLVSQGYDPESWTWELWEKDAQGQGPLLHLRGHEAHEGEGLNVSLAPLVGLARETPSEILHDFMEEHDIVWF